MTPELAFEPGSSTAYRTGDWRTAKPVYRDKWPPCSQTCPASEDIQGWLALANEQQWEAAWRRLTDRNPLPATMGRICYHPCEAACNRSHLDSAVNIHALERHLGDLAIANGWRHAMLDEVPKKQKIAVVGAGPAGLSCAFQLARRGYPVTLFDAQPEPGGTLRSGIPAYRLPKGVLADEIETILALGIELHCNTRIGREIGESELREQFDAVFLAIGTQRPRLYQGDSSRHSVMSGLDFLHRLNRGAPPELPSRVAVIGGGNTAIDVARSARRLGAEVTILSPQDPPAEHRTRLGTEMPTSLQEVMEAESERVKLLHRVGVRRLVRSGEHLSGIEVAHVDRVHDSQGRFNPVLFDGTEAFVPAGLAIFAIGQQVDWQGLEELRQAAESDGVWIGGDAGGSPRFAVAAVGSGYQTAMSILAALKYPSAPFEAQKKANISFKQMQPDYFPKRPRREGKVIAQPLDGFDETVQGLAAGEAPEEAARCLSCGVCFQCDNCWHFCPDAAVIKKAGGGYEIDYDFCKGCGICAQECPCGHIDMERVD